MLLSILWIFSKCFHVHYLLSLISLRTSRNLSCPLEQWSQPQDSGNCTRSCNRVKVTGPWILVTLWF